MPAHDFSCTILEVFTVGKIPRAYTTIGPAGRGPADRYGLSCSGASSRLRRARTEAGCPGSAVFLTVRPAAHTM